MKLLETQSVQKAFFLSAYNIHVSNIIIFNVCDSNNYVFHHDHC